MSKFLTDSQIQTIKKNKSVYVNAEHLTGVPWQAVAAVHFREHSLGTSNPERVGGPFQFDPPLTEIQMRSLLKRFTNIGKKETIEEYVRKGINTFETAAVFAACWLRHKSVPVITPTASDESIKDAFWGYNGKAYGSADKSPYVMNMYDSAHMNMVLRGTVPDKKNPSKRVKVETVDKRPGAFTIYKELKRLGL